VGRLRREAHLAGGGIHARSAKSIAITDEVKAALAISADALTPTELVNAILKAPVDLLYNGGIGTYVKSARETHADVGDRANDALRVNGRDLRCKVVVEGGNLGCTQLGRVEYARAGGRINTDAIDNSGGVGTSDHEVNIKILLGLAIGDGELTEKQRNALLVEMTDDVAALVLRDNYFQTQVLSVTGRIAPELLDAQQRFVQFLEREGRLNRAIEYLPSDEEFAERRAASKASRARARGDARVLQDLALRRARRLEPARRSMGGERARALLSRSARSSLRGLHGTSPVEAGDHRDACDQQHAEPRGQHLRPPAAGVHGAQPHEIVRAYLLAREIFGSSRCGRP
jgi:glutamate dehydrogenase